jgi:hypothetical protein
MIRRIVRAIFGPPLPPKPWVELTRLEKSERLIEMACDYARAADGVWYWPSCFTLHIAAQVIPTMPLEIRAEVEKAPARALRGVLEVWFQRTAEQLRDASIALLKAEADEMTAAQEASRR